MLRWECDTVNVAGGCLEPTPASPSHDLQPEAAGGRGRLTQLRTIREAVAASRAAAATAVTGIGVTALGVNCTAIPHLADALVRLRKGSDLPLVAYANNTWYAADSPWLRGGPLSPEEYGAAAVRWCGLGARLVGGCCGSGPSHIAAVAHCLFGTRLEWGYHANP